MSTQTDTDSGTGGSGGSTAGTALETVRNSFALKMALAGVAFILVGYVINTGVVPAILAIWGAALVVIGIGAFLFVRLSRRGTQG
ncbi:hypothetical protein [Saliphagus infecundisoli]|uniref:Uncharacterized protein n=1 Tax=Saliphagus infecundisoli TaxID=1849069 RepID=A0ABD5QDQ7_9EURY|nr:hypothetical protein [Saliphagus infecundisoli]